MALPLRPLAIPQCSACLRTYAWASFGTPAARNGALGQQTRGKKKMANNSGTVSVRLRKDVKTFGRKGESGFLPNGSCLAPLTCPPGAIVPVAAGQMRNEWFPRRVADYVTMPERKALRITNVPMERDFNFGVTDYPKAGGTAQDELLSNSTLDASSSAELQSASMFQKRAADVQRVSPERGMELLEIFVPPRLDFYRQPIIEEASPPRKPRNPLFVDGAAADLMAARPQPPDTVASPKPAGPHAIYGSVSTHDVVVAVRAAMGNNDEAARVSLRDGDVSFVDRPKTEDMEADKVKYTGVFTVEIRVKGAETVARRSVRVIAQET